MIMLVDTYGTRGILGVVAAEPVIPLADLTTVTDVRLDDPRHSYQPRAQDFGGS